MFTALKEEAMGACGTVNPMRKYMRTDIQTKMLHLNKGDEHVFKRSESLISCTMIDNEQGHFLSIDHNDNTYNKQLRDRNSDKGFREVVYQVIKNNLKTMWRHKSMTCESNATLPA